MADKGFFIKLVNDQKVRRILDSACHFHYRALYSFSSQEIPIINSLIRLIGQRAVLQSRVHRG